MLGIIIAILGLIAIISVVIYCITKTPDNLRGFYGEMFWTIAIVAIVIVIVIVIVGIL